MTMIDNNDDYQRLITLYPSARFLAVQNGIRNLSRDGGSIRHDQFACFSKSVIEEYRDYRAAIQDYYPFGSLRYARYMESQRDTKREFDLCLVSEFQQGLEIHYPDIAESIERVALMFLRYCHDEGKTYSIASRNDPGIALDAFDAEQNYYDRMCGGKAKLIPNVRGDWTSYGLMAKSNLSVGFCSTLLLEGLGNGHKVLFCNPFGHQDYKLPRIGDWYIENNDYERFKDRVSFLLRASSEDYARMFDSDRAFLMEPSTGLAPWRALVEQLLNKPARQLHG